MEFFSLSFECCDVFAVLKALAGKVAIDYTDLEADSEGGMQLEWRLTMKKICLCMAKHTMLLVEVKRARKRAWH
jgi:hypothetical protein